MSHLKIQSSQKAFTIIEMVLTIVVVISISAMGYLTYASFNKSQDVSLSYLDLINNLNEAKSSSLSQVKSSTCGTQTLVGYEISINSGNKSYTTNIVCSDATGAYVRTALKTTNLPGNTTISMQKGPVNASSFIFFLPNGMPDASYAAFLSDGSKTVSLGIDQEGVIIHWEAKKVKP